MEDSGAVALERLISMKNRNAAVFVISDCVDDRVDDALRTAERIYGLLLIVPRSPERHLPSVGFLDVSTTETVLSASLTHKTIGQTRSFVS